MGSDRMNWTERRLAPLYEAATALLTPDGDWRATLAEAVAPEAHDVVLEGGCGAGGLCHLLARMAPDADIVGVDPDEALVAQARARAAGAASFIVADIADAGLHLGAWTPTRVILNFAPGVRAATRMAQLQGARQIIDPAGQLFVASMTSAPQGALRRLLADRGRAEPSREETATLIRAAGFVAVEEIAVRPALAGVVVLHRARAS